jgi:hypothetical protein
MSEVVNVRKAEVKKLDYNDLVHWHVPGAVGSKWGNSSKLDKSDLAERLNKYEKYIRQKPKLMNSLGELENKVLGCWCHPEGCHGGDILIKLVDEHKNSNK